MLKIVFVVCSLFLLVESLPAPQSFDELKTSAILAAAQAKDMLDKGGAAMSENDFEVMGFQVRKEIGMGFGDAMKRNRRAIVTYLRDNSSSESSSDSDSSDEDSK